jgi:hypothetical protein
VVLLLFGMHPAKAAVVTDRHQRTHLGRRIIW